MKKPRWTPQERTIYELTLYIRSVRVHHAVKKWPSVQRRRDAQMLRVWRDVCWHRWRILYEVVPHMPHKTPWSIFSIRSNVKCG